MFEEGVSVPLFFSDTGRFCSGSRLQSSQQTNLARAAVSSTLCDTAYSGTHIFEWFTEIYNFKGTPGVPSD